MLSSIHPLGERARGNRFGHTATAFVLGSLLGGIAIGALVGGFGWVSGQAYQATFGSPINQSVALGLVALSGIVALIFEMSGKAIPSLRRQVNEDWLSEFRGWVYGMGFGIQLGAGVATYITSAAILVWLAAMFITSSLAASVAIGAVFGLVRGLSITTAQSINSPESLVNFHRFLHRSAPRVQLLGTVSLVLITATAGAMFLEGVTL